MYADDLWVVIKHNKSLDQVKIDNLFSELNNWCDEYGAKISYEKTKSIHFCRKQKCVMPIINIQSNAINVVDKIKILGLVFDKKYRWNEHIKYLKNALEKRLNLIKCITNLNCNTHPKTTINIIKSILVSKIEYGLPLYGHSAKAELEKIQSSYNAAARFAIGAFRSTPVRNILAETGLPTLDNLTQLNSAKLAAKLLMPSEKQILNYNQNASSNKKLKSAVQRTTEFIRLIEINQTTKSKYNCLRPPWLLLSESIEISLMSHQKQSSPHDVYIALFNQKKHEYSSKNWLFCYTDGSKSISGVSYSVVDNNFNTICYGLLNHNNPIFYAEAEAILKAIQWVKKQRFKFIICTDSKSCITAIQNTSNSNDTICEIRDNLIRFPNKLKIMWIPGHANIKGNETADKIAKEALKFPLIMDKTQNKSYIYSAIEKFFANKYKNEWNSYTHYYKQFNPDGIASAYPPDISRAHFQIYIRIRLGHCRLTHQHLMENKPAPQCIFCRSSTISMQHIVNECTYIKSICNKKNYNLHNIISDISKENVNKLIKLLKEINIYNKI